MKIILNGKPFETQYLRLFEIRDKYFDSACITILNGFQTSDNLTVKDGDIVSIIKKGVMPPKEELESLMATRHTPKVHDTVKSKSRRMRTRRTWLKYCSNARQNGCGVSETN